MNTSSRLSYPWSEKMSPCTESRWRLNIWIFSMMHFQLLKTIKRRIVQNMNEMIRNTESIVHSLTINDRGQITSFDLIIMFIQPQCHDVDGLFVFCNTSPLSIPVSGKKRRYVSIRTFHDKNTKWKRKFRVIFTSIRLFTYRNRREKTRVVMMD